MRQKLLFRRAMGAAGFLLAAQFASGQATTLNFTVTQPAVLVANAGAADTLTICPGDTIAIGGAPSGTGGTTPYTYAWSPATGLSSTTVANPDAHPASTQAYSLTVTDGRNCTDNDAIVVFVDSCLGFSGIKGLASMSIFPNPSNGLFNVEVSLLKNPGAASISIKSINGQNVYLKEWANPTGTLRESVNISSFSKGIYIVELNIDENSYSKKIIVQ